MRILINRQKRIYANVRLSLSTRRGELDVWVEGAKVENKRAKQKLIKAWAWTIVYKDAQAARLMAALRAGSSPDA